MVRSWDARVKGASQKVETDDVVDASSSRVQEEPEKGAGKAAAGKKRHRKYEPKPDESPADDSKTSNPTPDSHPVSSSVASVGMSVAIEAVELATVVVERSNGLIHWMSASWAERFGEQTHLARYMPSSSELGETPLPPPGEAWQRTRTIEFAEGGDDLVDILLLGAHGPEDEEIVTVVAMDRAGPKSVVTDRSEAISFVEGALAASPDSPVAVLYVDIDRFKVVHDLLGNVEARRLLDLIARRMSSVVRGGDLLFRLPSDEFVVIACELEDASSAEVLAERIRESVATLSDNQSLMDDGQSMAVTASVGVAVSDGSIDGDQLLSAAETAVHLAKGRGRNRIAVHDEELRSRAERLLTVERQLRGAIDNKEVRFAYQPLVSLENSDVVGAEVLLRLGGDIGLSAIEVVGAAEQSGLMGTLGTLVLEGVEDQLGPLLTQPEGTEIIMVNIAATQLADEGLNATIRRLLDDPDIPTGRLALEVPEVVAAEHGDAFEELVKLVRPKFKIGIDGFGTSYNSLQTLERVEVDYIKLHRSLTMSVVSDRSGRDEVEALIAGAERLGTTAIALGVERQDQVTILQSLGCSFAQGFLYAGAVNAPEFLELLESGFTDTAAPGQI